MPDDSNVQIRFKLSATAIPGQLRTPEVLEAIWVEANTLTGGVGSALALYMSESRVRMIRASGR